MTQKTKTYEQGVADIIKVARDMRIKADEEYDEKTESETWHEAYDTALKDLIWEAEHPEKGGGERA